MGSSMAAVWEREIAPGQSARLRRGAPFHLKKRSGKYMPARQHITTQQTPFRPQGMGAQFKKRRTRPRTALAHPSGRGAGSLCPLGMRRARQRGLQGEEREGSQRWSAGKPLPGGYLLPSALLVAWRESEAVASINKGQNGPLTGPPARSRGRSALTCQAR